MKLVFVLTMLLVSLLLKGRKLDAIGGSVSNSTSISMLSRNLTSDDDGRTYEYPPVEDHLKGMIVAMVTSLGRKGVVIMMPFMQDSKSLEKSLWSQNVLTEIFYDDTNNPLASNLDTDIQQVFNKSRKPIPDSSAWSSKNWRFLLGRDTLRKDEMAVILLGPSGWLLQSLDELIQTAVLGPVSVMVLFEDVLLMVSTTHSTDVGRLSSMIPLGSRILLLQINNPRLKQRCEGTVQEAQLQNGGSYAFRRVGCWYMGSLQLHQKPLVPIRNLKGAKIRMQRFPIIPEITVKHINGNIKYGGKLGVVLESLIPRLNMKPVLVNDKIPSMETIYGRLDNKSTDVAFMSISMMWKRLQRVDFSEWYWTHDNKFLTKFPKPQKDIFLLFKIYKWQVWCAISAFLVVSSSFLWLMWERSFQGEEITQLRKFRSACFLTLKAAIYIGSTRLPKNSAGRSTLCVIWMVIIILVSVYTGNLVAFLSIPRMEMVPNTDQEVIDMGYTLSLEYGFAQYLKMKHTPIKVHQHLFRNAEVRTDKNLLPSQEIVQRTLNNRIALLVDGFAETVLVQKYAEDVGFSKVCTLKFASQPLFSGFGGFAFAKNSLLKPFFDRQLIWVRQNLRTLKKSSSECIQPIIKRDKAEPLDLVTVGGVFMLWILGMVLATLCFFGEILTTSV